MKQQVLDAGAALDLTKNNYRVELTTSKGPIRLDFYADVAPNHVKNFVSLAKIGFYDNLTFHRVIDGFMIQGGCPRGDGTGDAGYKIPAEFNKKPHNPGVLSMARSQNPNSAGTQFFICLEKHGHLDGQYTAFGQVADEESMSTVKTIGKVKTGSSDRPAEKVSILKATVTESPKA